MLCRPSDIVRWCNFTQLTKNRTISTNCVIHELQKECCFEVLYHTRVIDSSVSSFFWPLKGTKHVEKQNTTHILSSTTLSATQGQGSDDHQDLWLCWWGCDVSTNMTHVYIATLQLSEPFKCRRFRYDIGFTHNKLLLWLATVLLFYRGTWCFNFFSQGHQDSRCRFSWGQSSTQQSWSQAPCCWSCYTKVRNQEVCCLLISSC